MKAEKIKVWGVTTSDGSGYGRGINEVLGWYPIKAAADGSPENIKLGGYSCIKCYDAIKFDDLIYIFDKEVKKDKVIGALPPTYIPTEVYHNYVYNNGYDLSRYYVGDEELLKLMKDGKSHSLTMTYLIRDDGDNCFILLKKEPITLTKFVLSREIAVAHALSKLSDEEKKLLGLI